MAAQIDLSAECGESDPSPAEEERQSRGWSRTRNKRLRTLSLEHSSITVNDDKWLDTLAVNCSVIETLNFVLTKVEVSGEVLDLIARKCRRLTSLKTTNCDLSGLVGFLNSVVKLEEFYGGVFDISEAEKYDMVRLPPRLRSVSLRFIKDSLLHVISPITSVLKKLDLTYACIWDYCQLMEQCPNLEDLAVCSTIGDIGLESVGRTCQQLRRFMISYSSHQVNVSHRGLCAVAKGCPELEHLTLQISHITQETLTYFGINCKKLSDFRLHFVGKENSMSGILDDGVLALLKGCSTIARLTLCVRYKNLTDVGLGYIATYGSNIRSLTLGKVGESDRGLLQLLRGCKSLKKLKLRECFFNEVLMDLILMSMPSLRFLWMQAYLESPASCNLMPEVSRFWKTDYTPAMILGRRALCSQILAYPSLVGEVAQLKAYTAAKLDPKSVSSEKKPCIDRTAELYVKKDDAETNENAEQENEGAEKEEE